MKHVLIKYKKIKLLINEGCSSEHLLVHLTEIESLEKKVSHFYANLLTVNKDEAEAIEAEKQRLISKIGYNIVGVPFTNQDAELYALDKKLDYTVLQLEDGVHVDKAPERKYERINIDVEKPLKTLAVKHVNNSHHRNLAQYIEYLIKKDLGL